MTKIYVDKDISFAETLPGSFYKSKDFFEQVKEKIFVRSWQFIGHQNVLPININLYPFNFLPNFIDEPLVLARKNDDSIKCLSNVCTHRANIIVHDRCNLTDLRCMYHGRKFHLNGKFKSMPEFDDAKNFPREDDNLKEFYISNFGPFLFAGLEPKYDIQKIFNEISTRVKFIPLDKLQYRGDLSKDYIVNSHWALYCDNYLEGFHIPFVHNDLNSVLDYGDYDTEIYDNYNLQVGYAKEGEEIFEIPKSHIDYGKNVAAYYYWLYPNIMLNFYPWGLSINIVKPINIKKTKVAINTFKAISNIKNFKYT